MKFNIRFLGICFMFFWYITLSYTQVFQKNYQVSGMLSGYHHFVEGVSQTTDGGYLVYGWTTGVPTRAILVKTNQHGVITWQKEYGRCLMAFGICVAEDLTASTLAGYVQQTSDGGFILTGSQQDRLMLIKTNATGVVTWSKTYGGIGTYGKKVIQASDGGYIAVGYSNEFDPAKNASNMYVVKTASNGNLQWDRVFRVSPNYHDEATAVTQLSNGDFVITGYSTEIFGTGMSADTTTDVLLTRISSIGSVIIARTYGTAAEYEEGYSIKGTSDGGYIIAGQTTQTTHPLSASDVFLWKFNNANTPVFQHSYKVGGFLSMDISSAYAAQETSDGGYALFGVTTGLNLTGLSFFNNYMLKLDGSAEPVFCKMYKDSLPSGSLPFSLGWTIWNDGIQLSNGGYLIGGSGIPLSGNGLGLKIIKTNSVGESGCSESNISAVKYTYAPISSNKTLTNLSTGAVVADINVYESTPTIISETVCYVTCSARAGNDTTVCEGSIPFALGEVPVAINGMPPYTYTWTPTTHLSAGNVANPVFTPQVTTTYTLTIQDSDGCTASDELVITVNPMPIADAGPDVSICIGDSTQLNVPGPSSSFYSWSHGAGNTQSVIVHPTITTTYTVIVIDVHSCGTATDDVVVSVVPLPTIISITDSICAEDVYTIATSITNFSGVQWSTSGTGVFSNAQITHPTYTPSINDINSGSVVLTAQVSGLMPCGNTTGYINLVILPKPAAPIFSNVFPVICEGSSPILLNTASPIGGTYSGLGVNNNQFSPIISGIGTHTITYTIADINGCTNFATNMITISPNPIVSLNNFSNVCVLTDSIVLAGGVPTGGTFSGNNISNNIFYPSVAGAGTHTISYTYTDGNGCSQSASSTISVVEEVNLFSNMPNNSVYGGLGQSVIITASPALSGIYVFEIDNNIVQSGTSNEYLAASLQASNIVYVTLNEACRDSLVFNVKPLPNAFTPLERTGLNDLFMPHVDLHIFNRWGQGIYKGNEGWDGTYNGTLVSPGTYYYLINVIDANGKPVQFKGSVAVISK